MPIGMGTAALIGGIATAAGNAASSIGSTIYSTERNIYHSSSEAQKQRDFEKELASNQYQRAVRDMEAAGLNPAAIGSGMDSNAVPSGAAATGSQGYATAADFSNIFSTAVKAAMARDDNVTRKIIQEMKDETALQVQKAKDEGIYYNEMQKKHWGHRSYLSPEELRKLYSKY